MPIGIPASAIEDQVSFNQTFSPATVALASPYTSRECTSKRPDLSKIFETKRGRSQQATSEQMSKKRSRRSTSADLRALIDGQDTHPLIPQIGIHKPYLGTSPRSPHRTFNTFVKTPGSTTYWSAAELEEARLKDLQRRAEGRNDTETPLGNMYIEPLMAHYCNFYREHRRGPHGQIYKMKHVVPTFMELDIPHFGMRRFTFQDVIHESNRTMVCRYNTNGPLVPGLEDTQYVIKFNVKFRNAEWNRSMEKRMEHRFLSAHQGDALIDNTFLFDPASPFLVRQLGVFLAFAPRLQAWESSNMRGYHWDPETVEKQDCTPFVAQIFQDIQGIDLHKWIRHNENRRNTQSYFAESLAIVKDISDGLNVLHRRGVFHGDLKPENVMIYYDESRNAHASLIDFDFAGSSSFERLRRGTPKYYSPEMFYWIYCDPHGSPVAPEFGPAGDVWILGAMMYALWFGSANARHLTTYSGDRKSNINMEYPAVRALLDHDDYEVYLNHRLASTICDWVSKSLTQCVRATLAYHPRHRPLASSVARSVEICISKEIVRQQSDDLRRRRECSSSQGSEALSLTYTEGSKSSQFSKKKVKNPL